MNDAPAYILCHPADSAIALAQFIVTAPTAYDAGKVAASVQEIEMAMNTWENYDVLKGPIC
jgi:hypothetical protein